MQKPDFGDSLPRRFCRKAVSLCEAPVSRHLLQLVFVVGPPALATYLVDGGDKLKVLHELGDFGLILQRSAVAFFALAWIWERALRVAYEYLKRYARPLRELSRDNLVAILESLDRVVTEKAKRMQNAALTFDQSYGGAEIFERITQPESQMALLTTAIHSVFESIDGGNRAWKTRLCLVEGRIPVRWLHWEPYDTKPRVSIETLQASSSGISRAINRRDIVVISDMEKELQKKKKEDRLCIKGGEASGTGSLLCIPITDFSRAPDGFVLCISCATPGTLREELKELYSWLLSHFVLRFAIEASLYQLKRKHCENQRPSARQVKVEPNAVT